MRAAYEVVAGVTGGEGVDAAGGGGARGLAGEIGTLAGVDNSDDRS